jgi:L-ascorbate metabolism protein UlaG (beta-lactamase superfamily)
VRRAAIAGFLVGALAACSGGGAGADAAATADAAADPRDDGLVLTWIGVTTWLLQYRDTAVLLDAYFSREPWSDIGGNILGAELVADLRGAADSDEIDAVLIGDAHFDHGFDLMTAAVSGAHIYGSQTSCYLAEAQGVAAGGCTVVGGGDDFTVGDLVVRAVRLPHSLPAGAGQYQELDAPPAVPLGEDSIPVGAQLAFHIEAADAPTLSLFFHDSFAALDADDGSGQDYDAALAAAYPDGSRARLWLASILPGAGDADTEAQVDAYLERIQPEALMAQHWDDLRADPRLGLAAPFAAPAGWAAAAAARDVPLQAAEQYFDRYVLTAAGFTRLPDSPLQEHWGL